MKTSSQVPSARQSAVPAQAIPSLGPPSQIESTQLPWSSEQASWEVQFSPWWSPPLQRRFEPERVRIRPSGSVGLVGYQRR